MTPSEVLARFSSGELTGFLALFQVRNREAEYERDKAESGDGQVIYHGREDDEDDGE